MEELLNTTCTICLSDLDGKRRTTTKCGHEFCSDCILDNIALSKTNKNKCPNCREDICSSIEPEIDWSTQRHIEGLEAETRSLSRQRHSLQRSNNVLNLKIQKHYKYIYELKYKNAETTGKCEYYTIKYHDNLKQKLLLMDANRKLRAQLKCSQMHLADNIKRYTTDSLLPKCPDCSKRGHTKEECAIIGCSPCLNCKGQHNMKECPAFSKILLSDFTDKTAIRLRMIEDDCYDEGNIIPPNSFYSIQNDPMYSNFESGENNLTTTIPPNSFYSTHNNPTTTMAPTMPPLIPLRNEIVSPITNAPDIPLRSISHREVQRRLETDTESFTNHSLRDSHHQIIEETSRTPHAVSEPQEFVAEPEEID